MDEKTKRIANNAGNSESEADFVEFLLQWILEQHQIPKEIFEIPRHPNYHDRFMELVRNPLVDRLIFRI